MYQWYETADKNEVSGAVHEGDHDSHHETTYSYAKDWFDKRVNSESFANPMGHHNTEYWPHNSTVKTNDRVKIGGFLLERNSNPNLMSSHSSLVMKDLQTKVSKCTQGYTFMQKMYGNLRLEI